MLMKAGSHAGCSSSNSPDSAAAAVLMQCSHMREQGGRLREDRWRMMGAAHMMDWEEQLWTHTSMVMVGTSNHSDAAMRSSAATVITLSPSTAQPPSHSGRHQLQSGVMQTLHMSLALTKSVEEAHEAVEPTTMTMTSAGGPRIRLHPTDQASSRASEQRTRRGKGPFVFTVSTINTSSSNSRCLAALWMNWPSVSRPSPPSPRRRRHWSPTAAAAAMDGVMCVDMLLPCVTTLLLVVRRWPFSSQALMTRAGRYTHTQMCEKRRHQPFPCDMELLRHDRDSCQHRRARCCCWWCCCDDGRACACALCTVFGATRMKTRNDTTRAHHSSPFISSFCSISDDDGGRGT
ncbi:hypothetical protein PTSG_06424 [Salpingoeca rosetta]|uniref:Uncharacterized protein n=1 Tax=Salpingoeca rosetta (strain ATCC 50818 / BSB-021) TaxID=946362 RepID=F2UFS0_SALR5|nr:uncharacterized protein PTSG_06424 [Salpingoeca rosetta]EGD75348.1 hypothetical protein PTSG_06424 [Salpingoeca rosetta]|eukprot:XP_004991805.1 hypothetical protein PTSG_06424 [Salpingoeca rosetta]